MENTRKIIAVTGARSEYDILYPVLLKLHHSNLFDLGVIVTGPHLSENYGNTIDYINKDGFPIVEKIYNLINTNQKIGRIISLGNQIPALAQAFDRIKPDIVLVVGDREEAIATTMTAAFMDIAVAHIAGGDIAKDGNIDNAVRYASSKFAHIHFTILEEHKNNLIKLGEDAWRIFTVGNPAIDRLLSIPLVPKGELSKKINFDLETLSYIVLIQHPIITNFEMEAVNIRKTLDAIVESGINCLINFPNSDPGNYALIEAYQEYAHRYSQFYLFQNLDRVTYVNILRHAQCLLGNSSSGLLEAPTLGLPVVNIGPRQRGRVHGANVTFVDNDKLQIKNALQEALYNENYRKIVRQASNPYGNGNAAQKIVDVLASIQIDANLIYKNITY